MRGISPIPTWAAANSINMTPQTCLLVPAEGEGELSTCGWEGLRVGNFCLGVGESPDSQRGVWGRVPWG